MGLFSRHKPKIKAQAKKKEGFSGWMKCAGCAQLIHESDLQSNFSCCVNCDHHYRISAQQRIDLLTDAGSFEEMCQEIQPTDPLNFVDTESYKNRIEIARAKTDRDEAVIVGKAAIGGITSAFGVMDFAFMGGSMGSVVGERLTRMIELGTKERLPVVIVCSSGGARMQESVLSLMQMAKTSAALARHHKANLPYISILTHPTTGGVTASFASLGDLIIAEPGALIAFAGPRVVEQTIRQKLPPGAQKSEFLLKHGMIDCITPRKDLKQKLHFFLEFFTASSKDRRLPSTLNDLDLEGLLVK